jgi:two-component system cell cycle sensor histidine kinase PleC
MMEQAVDGALPGKGERMPAKAREALHATPAGGLRATIEPSARVDRRRRTVMALFDRWMVDLGIVGATVALIAFAVALAEGLLYAIILAFDLPAMMLSSFVAAGVITVLVGTPIVVYSQILIRKLIASRRAMRLMTEQLAFARDAAEAADQAKSQFLASMSHELRTPLNAIIGFSEVMQAQMLGPIENARYRGYVNDIHDSGQHLLGIVNDVLDLAKIQSGTAQSQGEQRAEPHTVVDAALRMVAPAAERQGVTLTRAGGDALPALAISERMLRQILLNLLSNAVKFTNQGGRVTISTSGDQDGVRFVVADTGIGMSAEQIKIALTPFGQVDNTLTRRHDGTGLGLPLAKAMVELHDGQMTVESSPGQGTTITIEFPAERFVG